MEGHRPVENLAPAILKGSSMDSLTCEDLKKNMPIRHVLVLSSRIGK